MPYPASTREQQRVTRAAAYRDSRIQRLVCASRRLADEAAAARRGDTRLAAAVLAARTELDEVAAILSREDK